MYLCKYFSVLPKLDKRRTTWLLDWLMKIWEIHSVCFFRSVWWDGVRLKHISKTNLGNSQLLVGQCLPLGWRWSKSLQIQLSPFAANVEVPLTEPRAALQPAITAECGFLSVEESLGMMLQRMCQVSANTQERKKRKEEKNRKMDRKKGSKTFKK